MTAVFGDGTSNIGFNVVQNPASIRANGLSVLFVSDYVAHLDYYVGLVQHVLFKVCFETLQQSKHPKSFVFEFIACLLRRMTQNEVAKTQKAGDTQIHTIDTTRA